MSSGWRTSARLCFSLAATVIAGLAAPIALGTHSLPDPPEYWDCNGDNVADDSCVKARRAGAGWTVAKATRMSEALTEWQTETQFDPISDNFSGQPIYIDRLGTCISTWFPDEIFITLAVVCRTHQWKLGSYWKITGTPTYFNHQLQFHDPPLTWWTQAGAPDPDTIHFGGVFVHELGHWVRLVDLNCSPGTTMCNSLVGEMDPFDQFSLEQDDIDGANATY